MEIKHPSYYKKLAKKKKEEPPTADLFGVKDCKFCKGKGTYTEPDKDFPEIAYIEDCEHCNGTGSE